MGEFLNEVLEISAKATGKAKAMEIIKEINETIKLSARHGCTYIDIYVDTGIGGQHISHPNIDNITKINIYRMISKYRFDSNIFNYIIKYYEDEEFTVTNDDGYRISWKEKLNEYLLNNKED